MTAIPARASALKDRRSLRAPSPWCYGTVASCFLLVLVANVNGAQLGNQDTQQGTIVVDEGPAELAPPGKVDVQPAAQDEDIGRRLLDILRATGWFADPKVSVRDGVVFLYGQTDEERYKQWAGDLVRNTEGAVAVVNQITLSPPELWQFGPAKEELRSLAYATVRAVPLIVLALIVLTIAWMGSKLTARALQRLLRQRISSRLLREVTARACGILVFLLGLYLVLRVSGLTRLAVTVIGGTGLIGLILGIAFRDISENFLASLFLSLQRPFREGDLIEIANILGYVQQLTSRTTVLMTLNGNQVQLPNSTVFKSVIRNYTSNPNRREDFSVGVGYGEQIPHAQEVAMAVLAEHPAVLKEPEPWVLVDSLGTSTVNLRVYFWLDGSRHSWLKVKSSVIRLVKRAFQDAGISLPDEAREIIFPEGVPIYRLDPKSPAVSHQRPESTGSEREVVSTNAEAGLQSEAGQIKEQARRAWSPDQGENLLADTPNGTPVE